MNISFTELLNLSLLFTKWCCIPKRSSPNVLVNIAISIDFSEYIGAVTTLDQGWN